MGLGPLDRGALAPKKMTKTGAKRLHWCVPWKDDPTPRGARRKAMVGLRAKPLQQPCENPSTGNSRAVVRNVRTRAAPWNEPILKPHGTSGVSQNVVICCTIS